MYVRDLLIKVVYDGFSQWQYGSERNTVKGGYRKQNKLFHYLDMQREDSKKLEKHVGSLLQIVVLHCLTYRVFADKLSNQLKNLCNVS